MKFSRPVAVLAAIVILTSGASVAVGASMTQTEPLTLCSHDRTGAVSVPEDGTCPRLTTEFPVASDADVAALAGRVDTAEGTLSAHSSDLADLAGRVDTAEGTLSAHSSDLADLATSDTAQAAKIAKLEAAVAALWAPGTLTVTSSPDPSSDPEEDYFFFVRGTKLKPGTDVVWVNHRFSVRVVLGKVATDGTFTHDNGHACDFGPFHMEAIRENGDPIVTESHTGAGC